MCKTYLNHPSVFPSVRISPHVWCVYAEQSQPPLLLPATCVLAVYHTPPEPPPNLTSLPLLRPQRLVSEWVCWPPSSHFRCWMVRASPSRWCRRLSSPHFERLRQSPDGRLRLRVLRRPLGGPLKFLRFIGISISSKSAVNLSDFKKSNKEISLLFKRLSILNLQKNFKGRVLPL